MTQTPYPITLSQIPGGLAGVSTTLRIMRDMIKVGKANYAVRATGLGLVDQLQPDDWAGEARACFQYVRDQIRYVGDIDDIETLQPPDVTMEIGQGDCDDKCILLCSLLLTIGHGPKCVRLFACGFAPDAFSHVFVETKIGNRWFACETTKPVPFGWRPPGIRAQMIQYV